jgi:hypothetical protein
MPRREPQLQLPRPVSLTPGMEEDSPDVDTGDSVDNTCFDNNDSNEGIRKEDEMEVPG